MFQLWMKAAAISCAVAYEFRFSGKVLGLRRGAGERQFVLRKAHSRCFHGCTGHGEGLRACQPHKNFAPGNSRAEICTVESHTASYGSRQKWVSCACIRSRSRGSPRTRLCANIEGGHLHEFEVARGAPAMTFLYRVSVV
jgi:hypothetical protein